MFWCVLPAYDVLECKKWIIVVVPDKKKQVNDWETPKWRSPFHQFNSTSQLCTTQTCSMCSTTNSFFLGVAYTAFESQSALHGRRKDFFPGGPNSDEISFYQLETKRKRFSTKKLKGKISNFQIQGGLVPPCTPILTPTVLRFRRLKRNTK